MLKVPSLVAGYRFEGNANDFSGNGHNGTVYGATLTTGKFGKCYSFDGDDCISLSSLLDSIKTNTQGTICLWFYPYTDSIQRLWCVSSTTASKMYSSIVYNGSFVCDCRIGDASELTLFNGNTSSFSTEQWYFVSLVQDGITPKLYINGVLQSINWNYKNDLTVWYNDMSRLNSVELGRLNYSGGKIQYTNGLEDNVMYFNKVLSASDIKRVMIGLHPLGA